MLMRLAQYLPEGFEIIYFIYGGEEHKSGASF